MKQIEERKYQQRVVASAVQAAKDGHRTIMVVSPTGSGKTVMAFQTLREVAAELGWTKFAWTCMRKALLTQAERENNATFQVPGVQFFSSYTKDYPKDIDILVEDEAQHSASETSTRLFANVRPKVHLAMTATPFRTDRMKLCFSKVIQDAGIRQLITEGWLSPYHLYVTPMDWTPLNVAGMYAREPDRWGKSVIFFLTIDACMECQVYLSQAGIASEVVHGGSNQEEQIARFNAGEIDVLINVFVLTEGFDSPELKTVFVRPGSKGPTIQMSGRALRKHPSKAYAQIVQPTKTKVMFTSVASAAASYKWDEKLTKWVQQQAKPELLMQVQAHTIQNLMQTPKADIPKFLLAKKTKQRFFGGGEDTGSGADRAADRVNVPDGAVYENGATTSVGAEFIMSKNA